MRVTSKARKTCQDAGEDRGKIAVPSSDGMIQAYNAQAAVDCASRLLVDSDVSQRATDRTLLAATVIALEQLDTKIGTMTEVFANAGY